jgi:hypothetical protein
MTRDREVAGLCAPQHSVGVSGSQSVLYRQINDFLAVSPGERMAPNQNHLVALPDHPGEEGTQGPRHLERHGEHAASQGTEERSSVHSDLSAGRIV